MSYVLGVTGPTGSGKTTACKVAETLGWYVIDCDKLSREAVEDERVLDALVSAFGDGIKDENGRLIRSALAERAFCSRTQTELLNKTILPFIVELIKMKISQSKSDKILLDAPTLYESGADALCDSVCAILSDKSGRKMRITERDSLKETQADLRISAGKQDGFYTERAEHIIYNNSEKKEFVEEFGRLLKSIGGTNNG